MPLFIPILIEGLVYLGVALGVGSFIGWLLGDDVKQGKANSHKYFIQFEEKIGLAPSRRQALDDARRKIQTKIRETLKEKGLPFKGFYIQGSASQAFNTLVIKKDGTYDVDVGVYLLGKPTVTANTVQSYINIALNPRTNEGTKHLSKCIRVIYAGDFDIDLPIYYLDKESNKPYLAMKDGTWREDDPKGSSVWFKAKKKSTDGQLVRVIKYLKVWADKDVHGFKLPSGFALTVWASEHFVQAKERDDIALAATMKKILEGLTYDIECRCPSAPFDNLTENLKPSQKSKFKDALEAFIEDAKKAIASDDEAVATKLWQKHLGDRFPLIIQS